jgi:hypothetical protein
MRRAAVGAPETNQRLPSVQSRSEIASGLRKQEAAARPQCLLFEALNGKVGKCLSNQILLLISFFFLFYNTSKTKNWSWLAQQFPSITSSFVHTSSNF